MEPEAACRDPVEAVGPLCAHVVLGCLTSRDLARCGIVSRAWREAAHNDRQLWSAHLAKLWEDKVYVPFSLRELGESEAHRAFTESLRDAQRDLPTEEELCHFTWALSYKAAAWFSSGLGSITMRRYFHPNHTLTAPSDDPLWGGSEPQRHYWYFRQAPDGSTVLQVNTYPYLICRRMPDWGWELQNAMVRLPIDSAAGSNPGLLPDHPAAREALSLEQIRERFDVLLELHDMGDDSVEANEEEQQKADGD